MNRLNKPKYLNSTVNQVLTTDSTLDYFGKH